MRYVTRTFKMAVVEYEYLERGTKEVCVGWFTCRQEDENKIRKALIRKLEGENCVFVSIVDIQTKVYRYQMNEEKFIAESMVEIVE